MVFKWREDHTQLVLDILRKEECLWSVKSENYRNTTIRYNTLEEMAKQLNITDLTEEDMNLQIKQFIK